VQNSTHEYLLPSLVFKKNKMTAILWTGFQTSLQNHLTFFFCRIAFVVLFLAYEILPLHRYLAINADIFYPNLLKFYGHMITWTGSCAAERQYRKDEEYVLLLSCFCSSLYPFCRAEHSLWKRQASLLGPPLIIFPPLSHQLLIFNAMHLRVPRICR